MTIGVETKSLTLSKAVQLLNSRGTVNAAQKAGRKLAEKTAKIASKKAKSPPPLSDALQASPSPEYVPRRRGRAALALPPPLVTRSQQRALITTGSDRQSARQALRVSRQK